jgi:hypothetical protein
MMTGIGVQHRSESAFTFDRNRRSQWAGIRIGHGFGRFGSMGVTLEPAYDDAREALQRA